MPSTGTVECATCSALLEVYPRGIQGEPNLSWTTQDRELCKVPPVRRCPHAWADIKRLFPDADV